MYKIISDVISLYIFLYFFMMMMDDLVTVICLIMKMSYSSHLTLPIL